MYCKHCGAEINDDSKFCYKCGGYVEIPENMEKEEPPETAQPMETIEKQETPKYREIPDDTSEVFAQTEVKKDKSPMKLLIAVALVAGAG